MVRALWTAAFVLAVTAAPALAQRTRAMGRSADAWCGDGSNGDRPSFCEVREATIPGGNPLEVDAGRDDVWLRRFVQEGL